MERAEPTTPRPVPAVRSERDAALSNLGRRIYTAVKRRRAHDLVFDDLALRALVEPGAASRYSMVRDVQRTRLGADADAPRALDGTRFGGICIQQARLEAAHTVVGLRSPGWVFDRALVLAVQPGGRRIAWWVEGTFVFTDAGFGAVSLERVETPRWEHSDLELATCDMQVGMQLHNM